MVAEERLVYVDEAGIDNTIDDPYEYCLKGERFPATKLGYQTERVSMISGWNSQGGIVAPMVFEGYCNGNLFCQWLEEFLALLILGMIPKRAGADEISNFYYLNQG